MFRIVRQCRVASLAASLVVVAAQNLTSAQPLASTGATDTGPPNTFTASGVIYYISRERVDFFSDKPFWGPPKYGFSRCVLWPADTLFSLFVSGPTPIKLDGKRVGFAQLRAGQRIQVIYCLQRGFSGGMWCVAQRVEAHSSVAEKHGSSRR